MCVGPYIGAGTPQPKPAAAQTSEGVAQASPEVWRMLADKGGTMGDLARQKLQELEPDQTYPMIPKK